MTMTQSVPHSDPAKVRINGIEIVYDTFGEPTSVPLLLISGWGGQMIAWDEECCAQLGARGYWVIRFDQRDVGLSTKLDEAGIPDIPALQEAMAQGETVQAHYTLRDMADDAMGLLDALGVESAHLVGSSMGAGIAQLMAIHHPGRVRTMTLLGSTTDDPKLPEPPPGVLAVLLKPSPADREGYIESFVEKRRVLHGTSLPFDERRVRERAGRIFDRGLYPDGVARQLAANIATGSLKDELRSIKVPTLVIHGSEDPFGIEHGIDTAETIPGAELLIIEGMGHGLPPDVWPEVIEAIARHAVWKRSNLASKGDAVYFQPHLQWAS
jgi:pimeloyl-ACP methyl ester carboxylesterase